MLIRKEPNLNVTLTRSDKERIGTMVGKAYVDFVIDFLDNHWFPSSSSGERYLWENSSLKPWCEDWSVSVSEALNNALQQEITLDSGQKIRLARILRMDQGQYNSPPYQHNVPVMYPQGYIVSTPYHSDDIILIFDAWYDMLPNAYKTNEYKYKLDKIGEINTN
jgi:hypothetical protein